MNMNETIISIAAQLGWVVTARYKENSIF
ncbi:hypothetical protein EVA_10734, partial [gut metagenome]